MNTPILAAQNVSMAFRATGGRPFPVLKEVELDLHGGNSLALVGGTGSGKSTLARLLVGLLHPTEGDILFQGVSYSRLSAEERRSFRRSVQIVFQDPYLSLNPRHTIRQILGQPLIVHKLAQSAEIIDRRVVELLAGVGLDPVMVDKHPGELSGGQRQRINIARALSIEPRVLILDEPLSALDAVSARDILLLLKGLQRERRLTYLFITHDLGVVRHIAEEIVVMSGGQIVERGPVGQVLGLPLHPYTRRLVEAATAPALTLKTASR